jgi:hypothetical protein
MARYALVSATILTVLTVSTGSLPRTPTTQVVAHLPTRSCAVKIWPGPSSEELCYSPRDVAIPERMMQVPPLNPTAVVTTDTHLRLTQVDALVNLRKQLHLGASKPEFGYTGVAIYYVFGGPHPQRLVAEETVRPSAIRNASQQQHLVHADFPALSLDIISRLNQRRAVHLAEQIIRQN